ncbi:MAG: hypothetical protein ACOYL6_12235 [Bacteriovoracaceae bacterium]
MKKDNFLNELGMSMVEVMIAIGMAAGLSVVIMKNMDMQNKSSKTQSLNNEIENIKRIIQDFVGKQDPCFATFGQKKRGELITELKTTKDGVPFAKTGSEFQNTGIIITKMSIVSIAEEIDKNPDVGMNSYVALQESGEYIGVGLTYLRVWITKKKSSNGQQNFFGAADTYFDVPFFARFMDDDLISEESASMVDARESWRLGFIQQSAKLEAEVNTQLTAAAVKKPANAEKYTYAKTQIKLLSRDGLDDSGKGKMHYICGTEKDPTDQQNGSTDKADECKESGLHTKGPGPYSENNGNYTLFWEIAHPLIEISECGNHLSTGVK